MAQISLTPEKRAELLKRQDDLVSILASPLKQTSHGDKSATFKSTDEIKQAIDEINRILSGKPKTRIIKTVTYRGT